MFQFRSAVSADRDQIHIIVEAAYRPYIECIGRLPGPMQDVLDGKFQRFIEDGNVTLVVDNDETVAGVLVLFEKPDTLLLDNAAILPAYQGRGLGRMLIQLAEQRACEMGYSNVTLYTHAKMVKNRAMYLGYGYEEVRSVTEHGLDRVYFCKRLRATVQHESQRPLFVD
ncbi:unnamed protein product [Jaminaea pallidilutea]